MTLLLKNVKQVLATDEFKVHDVFIVEGKIAKIEANITENASKVIDCSGLLLAPGFIDVHVHLREPGGEYKETIATGTKAAARGGFTTICSMPNTEPVPDDLDVVKDIFARIKQDAVVRVLPYAAITKGLEGKQLSNMKELTEAGVFAFTDDGVGIQTADMMLQAMREAKAHDMSIVAHCEDNSLLYGGVLHDGEVSERLHLPGITSLSESVQIARDVLLAEETGCHYHVCHVSTKESVRVIRDAKQAGINVTAEVSPHHLLLTEEDILEDDGNFKMNPPLRSKADRDALLAGLIDGTIDFIATDHAPHSEEEKQTGFIHAPFGIVGLETAFQLLYTHLVKENKISLYQLIEYMTSKPANVFGLPYGKVEENRVADLTLIDLDGERKINIENFYSKATNTPFDQWKVNGIPVMTIVNGDIVYEEGNDD